MTNEKTFEILKEMSADPKARELFEGMEKPTSLDEMVAAYTQVADKLGYAVTAEDIKEAIEQEEARRRVKTDKIVSDMESLEDEDLEGVAGGFYRYDNCRLSPERVKIWNQCASSFDGYCWSDDACEFNLNFYYDCSGDMYVNGGEYDCTFNQIS